MNITSNSKDFINKYFTIFENIIEKRLNKNIKIFIGHGRNTLWKELKDHLHDKHNFNIIAYEIGFRAGYTVKEVLEQMLNESSFALLVLTGEDIQADGSIHARENVIHEVGLFQGKLGFRKAIILLEDEVNEFSNIIGIDQIRFKKGNIKEVFGEIIGTINREFNV
jgi:predicted nucleotide-binding protein